MSDGRARHGEDGDARVSRGASTDELIDAAVAAINRGDRVAASALADQVLAVDGGNMDAEDLLAARGSAGEIRRLTILFADLVDSTVLSTRVEPETYHLLVGGYRDLVLGAVNRFEGHIGSTKGDGLLAVFGHPVAHEDDVRRAVLAGLQITAEVARLSEQAQRRFGIEVSVRVGVHRGLVYLDTAQDDVYGLAANLAARVSGLAPPGTVVVSDAVAPLIRNAFELQTLTPAAVKGVDELIAHYQVLAEKSERAAVGRGPLVGRDRELARLRRSWARAQAGTLSTPAVVLRGEAGIGKSRLATAAIELVEDSGAAVLELAGSPFHTDAGLYPIRMLLERRCGIGRLTDPGERLQLLEDQVAACSPDRAELVSLLAPVLGIGPEHGYQPVAAEGRKLYELIGQAISSYLLACIGANPGLVVAEDTHWFDPSTMEVLGALLDAGAGRLLVVITERPGGCLPTSWPAKVVDLQALTDEQTDELITALNPGLTAIDRATVRGRSDGVPFYIEQVVGGVTETGVPEALYEPLFARLRATANAMPVLQAASIIGRQVDRGLLCSVVDLTDDEIDDVIDELEDALVLEPRGTDIWRFRHELLREVATELAPPSVRKSLHTRVADALVSAGGDPEWALVAGHFEQGESFDNAADAYQQASDDARRRGALDEARTYLTRALAQLERATPGPARDRREMAVRVRRGFLVAAAEFFMSREAVDDFESCLRLGGNDLRDDELFATLVALLIYYLARADLRRTLQLLESLRAGVEQGRPWFRRETEGVFGIVAFFRGDFDVASVQLERATAARAGAGEPRIDALWFLPNDLIALSSVVLAWNRCATGDLSGVDSAMTQAQRRIDGLGFPQGPYNLALANVLQSCIHIEAHQFDRAAVLAANAIDQADNHGFEAGRLWGATQQAAIDAMVALVAPRPEPDELSAHIAIMTSLLDSWRTVELNLFRTSYEGTVGQLHIAAGQLQEARQCLDAALALAEDTEMHFYDAELLRLRARTHTDPEARTADLFSALEMARRQGATLFELRSALDDFELRGEPARAALVDVVSRMPADGAFPEVARAKTIT